MSNRFLALQPKKNQSMSFWPISLIVILLTFFLGAADSPSMASAAPETAKEIISINADTGQSAPNKKAGVSAQEVLPASNTLYLPIVLVQQPYTITGQINDIAGTPVEGAAVQTNTGLRTTTATDGSYKLTVTSGYDYTITPQSSYWYHFNPVSQIVPAIANTTGVNFTALANAGDYIYNGGFEDSDGWVINSTAIPAVYTSNVYHSGSFSMQLGLLNTTVNTAGYSKIRQKFPIPPNAHSAQLTFWMNPHSTESVGHDNQYVMLLDSNDNTLQYLTTNNRRNNSTWIKYQYDLTQYAGQSVTLLFGVYNDGGGGGMTGMYIDDVSLAVTP